MAGSGKTTLATLLCLDDHVTGKFGENILFLTVSETPNLKTIVETLFQHHGCDVPDLHPNDDDRRTILHLKNLPKEIMKSPMMLVLDDVRCGSESLIDAFQVQQLSDYKILVTSRSINVSEFEHVYRLESLCPEDSVTLFHHLALLNDGGSRLSKDHIEKLHLTKQITKACCGSPLLLELVGGFLKRKRVGVWRQMVEKLFEGCLIVKSHTDLRSIFNKYLDHGLEDKPIIKECFMDLGLFPRDQKIPVAALIDVWTERQLKPGDDLDHEIKEVDAVNFVYDLTDQNLANLVVRREGASELDDYYNHHFLMQHNLYKEMIEANQEPYKQRERLMFDMNEKDNRSKQRQQNTVARTLSISNCEISTPELGNIVKAEVVEVLILNLRTNQYTFPEFVREMKELKVLIVTNYDDFHYSELNNLELFDFLSGLKRIRLERVSVTTFGKWHNLRKLSLYNCIAREAFESDSIPISDALPKLLELCIDYCRDLEKLPAGLCDITSIEKLSITRCMVFIGLPQDIGKLENLKILRLSSCAELKVIPTSIEKLRQLCFLDISGCVSLDDLPEQIGELLNLERLHMTGCLCKMLPSSVTKLKKLKNVICDEETAMYWKDFETSLPNLKIEEANDHSLFISYDNI